MPDDVRTAVRCGGPFPEHINFFCFHGRNFVTPITSITESTCTHRQESYRTLRDGSLGVAIPGTSCQAMIARSLRDKNHSPVRGPRIKLALEPSRPLRAEEASQILLNLAWTSFRPTTLQAFEISPNRSLDHWPRNYTNVSYLGLRQMSGMGSAQRAPQWHRSLTVHQQRRQLAKLL
jgi:hypothetical protein